MSASPNLPQGHSLARGQFIIQRTIQSGGFGITYVAEDNLKRIVAIKECYPPSLAYRSSPDAEVRPLHDGVAEDFVKVRDRFLHEARMLVALDHPSIVRVQSFFTENGTAYMAMDFLDGTDLSQIIGPTKTVAPDRLLRMAHALLEALDHAHRAGIVHLDIKPDNIRINAQDRPILIDFGAARAETSVLTRAAHSFNFVSDGYSPPEQYRAGAEREATADLYALAATLYHAIKGVRPPSAEMRSAARLAKTPQPDPLQRLVEADFPQSPILVALINRSLALAPEDRPQSADEWLRLLREADRRPPPPPPQPPKSRLVTGVALGALVTIAASAVIWQQQPDWLMPTPPEIQEMELTIAELRDAIATADAEITRLREIAGRMPEMETRMGALAGERDQARSDLEAAVAARADLSDRLNAALALSAARERDLAETEADLVEVQEALRDLEARSGHDELAIANLQQERDRILEQLRGILRDNPGIAAAVPNLDEIFPDPDTRPGAVDPVFETSDFPFLQPSEPDAGTSAEDLPFTRPAAPESTSTAAQFPFLRSGDPGFPIPADFDTGSVTGWVPVHGFEIPEGRDVRFFDTAPGPGDEFRIAGALYASPFRAIWIVQNSVPAIWSSSGELISYLEEGENVERLEFSADGSTVTGLFRLGSGSYTYDRGVWNVETGELLLRIEGVGDGSDAALTDDGNGIYVLSRNEVYYRDLTNGAYVPIFSDEVPGGLWRLDLAADGQRVVTSGWRATVTGHGYGQAALPDARNGDFGLADRGPAVVAEDGTRFATNIVDPSLVRVFDASTETPTHVVRYDGSAPVLPGREDESLLRDVQLSADGRYLATTDDLEIFVHDIGGSEPDLVARFPWVNPAEEFPVYVTLGFAMDAQYVIANDGTFVVAYDISGSATPRPEQFAEDVIGALAAPEGQVLVTDGAMPAVWRPAR